ncbi:MAG: DUF6734 family protein [Ginsengibacter sp.]
MKIVQSLWTKPLFKKDNLHKLDRSDGGWQNRSYNYMSWALSCLQLKKIYGKVELVTDAVGYDLLINKLKLPYTSISVALDQLNDYHHDLWALGKIYTYLLQEEPFLHVDGDIYIWEKFSSEIESAALVAQNPEKGFGYYKELYEKIRSSFCFIPDAILTDRERHAEFTGVCAGILGGNDIGFIKSYAHAAFEFVNRNVTKMTNINIGLFNVVFEQYLFTCMAYDRGIEIKYYTFGINDKFDGMADFTAVPGKVKYIHPVGIYKRRRETGEHLAHRLRMEHPEFYFSIMNLLRTGRI